MEKSFFKTKKFLVILIVSMAVILAGVGVAGGFIGYYMTQSAGGGDRPDTGGVPETEKIFVETSSGSGSVTGENKKLTELVAAVRTSVVEIYTRLSNGSGAGSGVILAESQINGIPTGNTYLITNHHVIDGAIEIKVVTVWGAENDVSYDAAVIGTDEREDIAVLMIQLNANDTATSAVANTTKTMTLAESVFAIGNSLGELGGTVSNGIVSCVSRTVYVEGMKQALIQTNTAINPGNSGGGLFDMEGHLVGIVNAKNEGSEVDNIGFAIPVAQAYSVANQLVATATGQIGYVVGRVDLGITVASNSAGSVYISSITKANTGLQAGYTISSLAKNGGQAVAIESLKDYWDFLDTCAVGDTVTVSVSRWSIASGQITADIVLTQWQYRQPIK